MSEKRITRMQPFKTLDHKNKIEEFNPFIPRKELPQDDDEHFLNASTSSNKDTERLNISFSHENPFDISIESNNSTKTLVDLSESYLDCSYENQEKIEINMSISLKLI